jgi:hypothetical protein
MAIMYGLPLFVLHERGVNDGVFGVASDHGIYRVKLDDDWKGPGFIRALTNWCAYVRDRGQPLLKVH